MSNDETFLEAFIESTVTLPHDLRRNLDLLKVLDKSCVAIVQNLQSAEDSYIEQAQEKILNTPLRLQPIVPLEETTNDIHSEHRNTALADEKMNETSPPSKKQAVQSSESSTSPIPTSTKPTYTWAVPTTEELMAHVEDVELLDKIQQFRQDARQKVDEKVTIAQQAYDIIDSTVQRLDKGLMELETLLKSTGEFDTLGGPKPNDLAAIQVNPNSTDWILAKVISHDTETGMYNLSDEDVESNKIFNLPESQVVVLGNMDRLTKGDTIYAVYPDTTSFYQATVVQGPRKTGGASFVLVHFQDDGDENGVTHDKAVLLKHCMPSPYVVTDRRM